MQAVQIAMTTLLVSFLSGFIFAIALSVYFLRLGVTKKLWVAPLTASAFALIGMIAFSGSFESLWQTFTFNSDADWNSMGQYGLLVGFLLATVYCLVRKQN